MVDIDDDFSIIMTTLCTFLLLFIISFNFLLHFFLLPGGNESEDPDEDSDDSDEEDSDDDEEGEHGFGARARRRPNTCLVVAPAIVVQNWNREVRHYD